MFAKSFPPVVENIFTWFLKEKQVIEEFLEHYLIISWFFLFNLKKTAPIVNVDRLFKLTLKTNMVQFFSDPIPKYSTFWLNKLNVSATIDVIMILDLVK